MDYHLGLKEDAGKVIDRFEAFYQGEIIDRALVSMTVRRPDSPGPGARAAFGKSGTCTEPSYRDLEERWLDVEGRAERAARDIGQHEFIGDTLPVIWPNMGPEIFSACCGCGYVFGEETAWSEPAIIDWERDGPKARFDPEHPYFRAVLRFTEALIGLSEGRYIVGLTDFHPGGDHLAALRDPANLAMDLIDDPGRVKALLSRSQTEYFDAYDRLYAPIARAGMPATSWINAPAFGRFYIPSCDFAALISTRQFEEFFLPGLIDECRFYDRSIYHMDGPGQIRHLDSILSIPRLNAIQWVPGAGHEELAQWIPLLKRIRSGGKSVMVYCRISELDLVFDNFRPEGIWLLPSDVDDGETARAVLRRVEKWKAPAR